MERGLNVLGRVMIFGSILWIGSCQLDEVHDTPTRAFENGYWFTGESFTSETWYSVGGVLSREMPGVVDSVIDLHGGYVIPPFAEGHNHLLEWELIDAYVQMYLDKGIYYVKDQANTPFTRSRIDSSLNTPMSIDFVSANQGFTGPGGHPLQIVGQLQQLGALPPEWTAEDIDGEALFIVESQTDIDARWPLLLASQPDFVKVYLLYSEECEKRARDPEFQYRRGIDPALVVPIVERAQSAGLQVSAHIYSATDFRNAVTAGVDQIAHFPGVGFDPELGPQAFVINDDDAALAAKNGVTVLTTLSGPLQEHGREFVEKVVLPNISTLQRHGVRILIGSDLFRRASDTEAQTLAEFGVFDNLELLNMWCVETPQMIFPERKIGVFEEGYEASFLVLAGNPIEDFSSTQKIRLRCKQGHILSPNEYEFPPLGGS
jgi:hypothetical protein